MQHGDGLLQVGDLQTALDERGNQVTTLQQKLDASEKELNRLKRKNDEFNDFIDQKWKEARRNLESHRRRRAAEAEQKQLATSKSVS